MKQSEWTVATVRNWLIKQLYETYEEYGEDGALEYSPSKQGAKYEENPPRELIKSVAAQLEKSGFATVFGETMEGYFSIRLLPHAYADIRENIEQQAYEDSAERVRRIGFQASSEEEPGH